MQRVCFGLLLWLVSFRVVAQQDTVVMCIDGKQISRSEFLSAYDWAMKHNVRTEKKTLKDFVRQYVDCKLKVAAAEAAGMDTTSAFMSAMDSLRRRLSATYLGSRQLEDSVARCLYGKLEQIQGERILVRHLFKRLPQNVTTTSLRRTEQWMDSIYGELQRRQDAFGEFVDQYSDEKEAVWIAKLQMPVEYETVVWQLNPGEFSAPFFTPQGIYIVKVLERGKMPPFAEVKGRLVQDGSCRLYLRRSADKLVEHIKAEYGFKQDEAGVRELLARGETHRTLFTLAGKEYDGDDFARFAQAHPGGTKRQLDAFVQKSVLDCGYVGLEQDNADYGIRMQACRDTLLCRAISRRETELRGGWDEAGLEKYFAEHRADYAWEKPRYKGIVLQCVSRRVAKRVRKFLKQVPEEEWQDALRMSVNTGEDMQVQASYGVFSFGENAFVDEKIFHSGKAEPSDSYPAVVLLGNKIKGPVDYREVGERLTADYQRYLQSGWMAELRAKSKVEINQEVLKTVNNH